MKLERVAVLERLVDDEGVLADDLICLESEESFLDRVGVCAHSLPPVLEILHVCWNPWMARPFGGDVDSGFRVGALVIVLHVAEEQFPKSCGHILGPDCLLGSRWDVNTPEEVEFWFCHLGKRTHVLSGGGGEVVDQRISVLEDMVDQHRIFTDGVIDLCGQHSIVGSGALMDVLPFGQHLFGLGRLLEQPTGAGRNPFAGDTYLLTNP